MHDAVVCVGRASGGDSIHRRAGGYGGYEILSYSEGIQSDLVAQRVGEGIIQLRHGTR